ncbi:MAG TPA: hypothetical protein VFI96_04890, partial [Longimicrobiaceae bacterium]|nr:hypothetical protein [Longimicrobiaceae bacterium]
MRRWKIWGVVAVVTVLASAVVGCRDDANGAPKGEAEAADEVVQPLDSAVRANVPQGEKVETVEAGRKLFLTCAV